MVMGCVSLCNMTMAALGSSLSAAIDLLAGLNYPPW